MPGMFKSAHQLTVGEVIALAREPDSGRDMREALKRIGLRLERLKSEVTGRLEFLARGVARGGKQPPHPR